MTRFRIVLAIGMCATALAAPAAAQARYSLKVGIGDQSAAMFDQHAFQALHIHQIRYLVPWNTMRRPSVQAFADAYVRTARAHGGRVLLQVTTTDYRIKHGHLVSTHQYRRDVGALVRHFRALGVHDFGVWDEANHASQETWNHPRSAARYFKEMRRAVFSRCSSRTCRVVGLDVLDQAGVARYIRRFVHYLGRSYARRYLRIVGVHNYSDVNRRRTRGLRTIIHAVQRYTHSHRAHFWLTETGGVVKFGHSFPCSTTRAAHRLDYLFSTMRRYRHQLQRVYLYNWTGTNCHSRFDAGLTNSRGAPRKGYYVVKRRMRAFSR
jgi:hypothetical protein